MIIALPVDHAGLPGSFSRFSGLLGALWQERFSGRSIRAVQFSANLPQIVSILLCSGSKPGEAAWTMIPDDSLSLCLYAVFPYRNRLLTMPVMKPLRGLKYQFPGPDLSFP